ncbi:DUF1534 domain-containing protein [Pseudomonas sp. SXM-1]|nr:DUF1534 domain-containing protein [Pseudomonas sp. SXM-1]
MRGNASCDALRHRCAEPGRGASGTAFPRRAWERSIVAPPLPHWLQSAPSSTPPRNRHVRA